MVVLSKKKNPAASRRPEDAGSVIHENHDVVQADGASLWCMYHVSRLEGGLVLEWQSCLDVGILRSG